MMRRLRRALAVGIVTVFGACAGWAATEPARAATPSPSASASASASAAIFKYYVVSSGYQGQKEFLYEIAQRFLGNGNLETEIFALNKGRVEADGQRFTNPAVIDPGWLLRLPAAATGDGVITGAFPRLTGLSGGEPVKYYVVANTYKGKPEFLAEIAQRFLGNANLASEVFDLNKGRLEPDGQTVSNTALIDPGWYLVLPTNAHGDGLVSGQLPTWVTPGASSAPVSTVTSAARASTAPAAGKSGSPLILVLGIVVVVLLLGGGTWWAVRRGPLRRARRARSAASQTPAIPLDDAAAWTIDRVLRTLATACARAERPLPAVCAVVVGTETLWLRLSSPDVSPAAPWSVEDQGRTWSAPLRVLQSAEVDDTLPTPFPRLVSLGGSPNGRVLLNLAEAHNVISLDGEGRAVRALAAEWARELSGSPWSHGVSTLRVGFPDQDAEAAPGAQNAANLEAAAAFFEETDRGVLLFAHPPTGRELERLSPLLEDPDRRWSVVVLGNPKNAGWRLVADAAGNLETGLLAEPIRLYGLGRRLAPA